jgi:hypothetical protein
MCDCWNHRWNSLLRIASRRSAIVIIVTEFQGYPGNDVLVAAISFSETISSHGDRIRQVRRVGPEPRFFLRPESASGYRLATEAQTLWSSTPSWSCPSEIAGVLHARGLTCQTPIFVDNFALSTLSSVQLVEGTPSRLQPSTKVSPRLKQEKLSTVSVLPLAVTESSFKYLVRL